MPAFAEAERAVIRKLMSGCLRAKSSNAKESKIASSLALRCGDSS